MSILKPYTDDQIRSEVKRLIRLYPREKLDEAIIGYIGQHFTPRLSPSKGHHKLADRDTIIGAVCGYFRMSLDEILQYGSIRTGGYYRHILWYFLATRTKFSLSSLAKMFDTHHTTLMAARNKIVRKYVSDPNVRADVDAIQNLLYPKS